MSEHIEEWRVIKDAPLYDISNLGHVRSKRSGKLIKPTLATNGAAQVHLYLEDSARTFRVARLVWTHFKGDAPKGTRFEHINGDLTDDRLENLKIKEEKKQTMKLTKEEFAAGLQAAQDRETPEAPGSIAEEIARDLKREKIVKERITPDPAAEIPEQILPVKRPEPPKIRPKVQQKIQIPETVVTDPATPKLHGTIHGPLAQVVKMLEAADLGNATVVITFEE